LSNKERRVILVDSFLSGNIDFWTDGHRHEQFGAITVDVMANRYDMADGESLFMSDATRAKLEDDLFVTRDPSLENLEFPLNFERFDIPKTVPNVTKWMFDSAAEAKLRKEDFGRLSADGGSNAVGSVQEFEVIGREMDGGRSNNTDFVLCHAHQNERSGGYASGTAKFASRPNEPLGGVLKKNHNIHQTMSRNTGRMGTYRGVQEGKQREPPLSVKPANKVRWNGESVLP